MFRFNRPSTLGIVRNASRAQLVMARSLATGLVMVAWAACNPPPSPGPVDASPDATRPDSGADAASACDGGCAGGQSCCAGLCVDTSSDRTNCGACGNTCIDGASCIRGVCACPLGSQICANMCTNTSTDKDNCGSCSNACRADQVCESGVCTCPFPLSECSGACVDESTDRNNCGGCGQTCPGSCSGGMCVPAPDQDAGSDAESDAPSDAPSDGGCDAAACAYAGTATVTFHESGTCNPIWTATATLQWILDPSADAGAGVQRFVPGPNSIMEYSAPCGPCTTSSPIASTDGYLLVDYINNTFAGHGGTVLIDNCSNSGATWLSQFNGQPATGALNTDGSIHGMGSTGTIDWNFDFYPQ